jgi:hypothetical protein
MSQRRVTARLFETRSGHLLLRFARQVIGHSCRSPFAGAGNPKCPVPGTRELAISARIAHSQAARWFT